MPTFVSKLDHDNHQLTLVLNQLMSERLQSDIDRLKSWVNINSGTANLKGNMHMLQEVQDAFLSMPGDGKIEDLDDVDLGLPKCYVHRCRPEAPVQILLNGHADTVFSKEHAFQHCESLNANHLRGPGITDMKGGLVIMIAALSMFESLPESSNVGWEVLITCDEEVGSRNSRSMLEQAAKRNHLGITFESSLPDKKLVRKRMGIGTYTAEVKGRSAHVGRNFREGRSAIVKLCDWIQQIHSLNDKVPGAIVNVGNIEGGGPLNVVSEAARAQFNLRVENSSVEELLFERLDQICKDLSEDGYQLKGGGSLNRSAKEAGPAFDLLFDAWKQAAEINNLNLALRDTGGGSDGNILQSFGLPIIDNLGAVGDKIHSDGEYIELDCLQERSVLVSTFLSMLARGCFDDGEMGFAEKVKSLQFNVR